MVHSPQDFHIELVGPVPRNVSWQAKDDQAYDISHFQIDWEAQQVTCPQGKSASPGARNRIDRANPS